MQKKVLIIAGDFSEDYEVMVPFQVLQAVGFKVHVVCPKKKAGEYITTTLEEDEGFQTYTEKVGHRFFLNYDFDKVVPEEYDALVLPGGRAPEYLRLFQEVLNYTRHFTEMRKPILVVCHGVQILTAIKGCLDGVTLSGYYAQQIEIENAGGKYEKIKMEESIVYNNFTSSPAYTGFATAFPPFIQQIKECVTFDDKLYLYS